MGPVDNRVRQVIHVQLPLSLHSAGRLEITLPRKGITYRRLVQAVSREMTSDNRMKTQDPK